MKTEEVVNKRSAAMGFQFCIAVYVRSEYEVKKEAAGNLYSEWAGVEFGNSWASGRDRAQEICKQNPEYLCVLSDMMRRKKSLIITLNHEIQAN